MQVDSPVTANAPSSVTANTGISNTVQGTMTGNASGMGGKGTTMTDTGAREQAATTAPEGTRKAEEQRTGGNVEGDRQIDERA